VMIIRATSPWAQALMREVYTCDPAALKDDAAAATFGALWYGGAG